METKEAAQTLEDAKDDRFQNWFEALDWMYEEEMKTDFEVVIIDCGAYGFPLTARMKGTGRCVVDIEGCYW